jgi:hypothetical protein
LADNKLSGAELKQLLKYPELRVIKFGANNVKELSEIEVLVSFSVFIFRMTLIKMAWTFLFNSRIHLITFWYVSNRKPFHT